jgi:SpoVK/Ycf46/Vps4 family AAA+-type ATPase
MNILGNQIIYRADVANIAETIISTATYSIMQKVVEEASKTFKEKEDLKNILKQMKENTDLFLAAPNNDEQVILSGLASRAVEDLRKYCLSMLQTLLITGNDSEETAGRCFYILFEGPPGTGKSSSARSIYDFIGDNAKKFLTQKTVSKMSDRSKKMVKKARQFVSEKKLLVPFFLPGSIFAKYSDQDSLKFIDLFFQQVEKFIKDGKIVYIVLEEIDALFDKNNNSNLLSHILTKCDGFQNAILKDYEGYPGGLFLIGTTNKSSRIQQAFARRFQSITMGVIPKNIQEAIFRTHLNYYAGKKKHNIKHNIGDADFKKITSAIDGVTNFAGGDILNIVRNSVTSWKLKNIEISGKGHSKKAGEYNSKPLPKEYLFEYVLIEVVKKLKIYHQVSQKKIEEGVNTVAKRLGIDTINVSDDSGLNMSGDKNSVNT